MSKRPQAYMDQEIIAEQASSLSHDTGRRHALVRSGQNYYAVPSYNARAFIKRHPKSKLIEWYAPTRRVQ